MISINNITKEFGGEALFSDVSFNINPKDRIGLAGVNGAGKSTLLKIFAGEIGSEKGKIIFPSDLSIGYLPQDKSVNSTRTVFNEVMTAFDFIEDYKKEIDHIHQKLESENYQDKSYEKYISQLENLEAIINIHSPEQTSGNAEKYLMGLGFKRNDLFRPMTQFSQGWQMRVEIAKLLLLQPKLLLLDEPTNHLDIESIQWVEEFLVTYHGAVVLVSHDRSLLDNVTNRTIEISNGKIYDYKASYSEYIIQRQDREDHLKSTFSNQQREINEIERFIERFRYKASKAKQVQSRVKLLEKMDKIELDNLDQTAVHFRFPSAPHSGKVTIDGKKISKRYDDHLVLDKIDFEVLRGEKIAFLGRNGEGKSTLAKIIADELDFTGDIKLGHQVITSYFAQDQGDKLDPELTVFDTIDNVAVGEIRKHIKSILGAFLFRGEEINKKVKVLSGGEKSRLALAIMLLTPSNLLLLDEPTNHLDMRTKDILKNALLQFNGTIVIVSHDRDFLSGLTDRIYEFRNKGLKEFRGDIEEFLKSRKIESLQELERKKQFVKKQESKHSDSKISWQNKKEQDRRLRKIKNEITKLEERISVVEDKLNVLNDKLTKPGEFEEEIKSGNLYKDHDTLNTELQELYSQWELKNEEMEKI